MVSTRLDRVEELPVGSGQLDLSAYLRGNLLEHRAGVQAEYSHRVKESLSVFGQAWAGTSYTQDAGLNLDYGVLAGMRWRF